MNTNHNWNAVFTRPNCEKKVCKLLEKKGIVHYWPQNRVIADDGSQKKSTTTSLFPSLIFVQVYNDAALVSLSKISDIINVVYWQQNVAIFPYAEIDSLQRFLEAHESVQLTKLSLHATANDAQQYINPIFSGDNTYSISLPSVGYCVSAKAEPVTNIKLLRKKTPQYRTTNNLAFILGLKVSGSKFE